MENKGAFRRYYNDYMYSELLVFEKKRKRLIFRFSLIAILLLILSSYIILLDVFALSVFLLVPWGLLLRFYNHSALLFKAGFKPLVVRSLLHFIDSDLKYYHDQYISKDTFLRSGIFPINPDIYNGEDYIMGKIGEIYFELCELKIHHKSQAKAKLEKWFEGIFFHANFNTKFKGRIVIIPKPDTQRFISVIKEFTKYGGYELEKTGNSIFDDEFLVYLDSHINYKDILTPELISTINNYHFNSGKKVFASFYNSHFYLAIEEPNQLLEATIFGSNIRFEMIEEYHRELRLFTRIVEDFDITH